jgi:hypothetical protein
MGFLDKAKKMAEQAQAKLDDAQQQFNSGQQSGQPSGPAVEYDNHGRPIATQAPDSAPPHGDPVASHSTPPPTASAPPPARTEDPVGQGDPLGVAASAPSPSAPPAPAPPAQPSSDAPAEDRNHPSYAPPKLSSGDPLAG